MRLQLWDIAGQERYGQMTRVYYKDAVGAFVVFDVTRQITFDQVVKWKADIDSKFTDPIPIVLLANKVDLVTKQEDYEWPQKRLGLDKFCKEHEFVGWYETSAHSGFGIDSAFVGLIEELDVRHPFAARAGEEDTCLIRLDPGEAEKKECC